MLGADVASVLPQLQVEAESMMITACRVLHPTGVTVDPETGLDTPTYADDPVYEGGCKIQERDLEVNPASIPGGVVPTSRWEVHVPVAAGPFTVGDVVQILDGSTVVRELRVSGLHRKSWQTAQRLPVEEVT